MFVQARELGLSIQRRSIASAQYPPEAVEEEEEEEEEEESIQRRPSASSQ
jgi:hypothetical protein